MAAEQFEEAINCEDSELPDPIDINVKFFGMHEIESGN